MKTICMLSLALFSTAAMAQVDPEKAMNDLQQLVGEWRTGTEKGSFTTEVWQPDSAGFSGTGMEIKKEKTVFEEFMRIFIREGTLYYSVRTPDQNKGAWIDFAMTDHTQSSWLFENPAHDFPKKLHYELLNEKTLHVKVNGKSAGFELEFSKQ